MLPTRLLFATLTALILLTQQSQSQSVREAPFYKGGLDTLTKNVFKNVIAVVNQRPRLYLLFYEISLDKKGFKSIRQIYAKPDSISLLVSAAIQKTAARWIGNRRHSQKIILPVFLLPDEESKVKVNTGVLELSDRYRSDSEVISNAIICSPIQIIYYEPVS